MSWLGGFASSAVAASINPSQQCIEKTEIVRWPLSALPIAGAVWAGNTLYVSGWLDPDIKIHSDTKSQTERLLKDVQ
jgi:hypothetical protein